MVEYLYTEGNPDADIPVRLDGKRVGTIRKVTGGWQYFPYKHKFGGEVLPTAQEVQQTLEEE